MDRWSLYSDGRGPRGGGEREPIIIMNSSSKDKDGDDKDEEEEGVRVREFLKREVKDWDDPVKAAARFKGFNGQRSDWEGQYVFWRELILKVARHLGTFTITPSRLEKIWFRSEGALSPLCLQHVLSEMYNAGDLLRDSDLLDPTTTRGVLWKALQHALGFFRRPSSPHNLSEDYYILSPMLKERALEVVKVLSENHWTSSCVITLRKFQEICGGLKEASALLSYLSGCGKARYLVLRKNDVIEGVKVSLCQQAVTEATNLDYDVLHLIWTVEKLEQQLDVIDQRCHKSKESAVAYLKSGNRRVALRHARELKLAFQSREKCTVLLNRVEEVLRVVTDAESSRKVSEAIILGAEAIRESGISIEEVELCLQDLDMSINSLKQADEVLGSNPASLVIEDEDIEDELKMLELEIEGGSKSNGKPAVDSSGGVAEASETIASLSDALSNLNVKGSAATKSVRKQFSESCIEV